MPGLDKPNHPRPHKVLFSDNEMSWIDCGKPLANPTCIYDFDGANFSPTPDGTYNLFGGGELTVLNGIIQ